MMLAPLRHPAFRALFAAQIVALAGTGLTTVALGLLAFELAGADAGAVLGTALAIKMIAYVGVAPFARAFLERLPSRGVLIALDLIRAVIAASLVFVGEIWQIYALIFLLQSASAAFTPTFQAVIPEILTDERDYTSALSLSRLAYDLESLVSPVLVAVLLTVIPFHGLFAGTAIGFLGSAGLVMTCRFPPSVRMRADDPFWTRATRGLRIFVATPRLRGLLALNLTIAACGSLVLVNTVVFVRDHFALGSDQVAIALAAFGAGSMVSALALPRLLDRVRDRSVMLAGGGLGPVLAAGFGLFWIRDAVSFAGFLGVWFALGLTYSAVMTPSGRLLRRSADAANRPSIFAAQFALSHGCWLIAYPLAGFTGAEWGLAESAFALAFLGAVGFGLALWLWPANLPRELPHLHTDLAPDHPHVQNAERTERGFHHSHVFLVDSLHRQWPTQG